MDNILNAYINTLPTTQNAVDIFKGEWSSTLPIENLESGQALLFDDPRITWALEQLGGVQNAKVLELGPLEAGHSFMLEQHGAASVLAIEANTRNYLKCLIAKEILGLQRVQFLLGDFVEYLRQTDEKFDVCIASGVLYHMVNPAELIELVSQKSQKVAIWTHYYDAEAIAANPNIPQDKFSEVTTENYKGFAHTLHQFNYHDALAWNGFCGGSAPFSKWMLKNELLDCLKYFGFQDIKIAFDEPNHPNGPSFFLTGQV